MHIRFLIGGTGNQLFQVASAPSDTRFSTILNNVFFTKIFRWTSHPQLLKFISPPPIIEISGFLLLVADLLLFKVLKFSLFTDLDLGMGKSRAIFRSFLSVGYFQDASTKEVHPAITAKFIGAIRAEIVCHIRGGDFLIDRNASIFGKLGPAYYRNALERASFFCAYPIIVFSNDEFYAASILSLVPKNRETCYQDAELIEMIERSVNCSFYIASNSTLSFWIVLIRSSVGRISLAPKPFHREGSINLESKFLIAIQGEYSDAFHNYEFSILD